MHLRPATTLGGVEGAHTVDIVPHIQSVPGARSHHHEGSRKLSVLIQLFRQFHMFLIIIDMFPAIFPVNCLKVVHRDIFQFFLADQSVP